MQGPHPRHLERMNPFPWLCRGRGSTARRDLEGRSSLDLVCPQSLDEEGSVVIAAWMAVDTGGFMPEAGRVCLLP